MDVKPVTRDEVRGKTLETVAKERGVEEACHTAAERMKYALVQTMDEEFFAERFLPVAAFTELFGVLVFECLMTGFDLRATWEKIKGIGDVALDIYEGKRHEA